MKTASTVLIILGIIGVIVFGVQAIQESESFTFLGMDVAVSKANWTPLIVSGAILLAGLVLARVRRR
jgi:hypothetical protein